MANASVVRLGKETHVRTAVQPTTIQVLVEVTQYRTLV